MYPVQQGLWEAIDGVLFNKALALAKDIAAELKVSPQALIEILKQEDRTKFVILPDDDDEYQCQALVQRGQIYMRCRCPTLGPAPRVCRAHVTNTLIEGPGTSSLPRVERIVGPSEIYVVNEDKLILSLDGTACGPMRLKDSVLKVFKVDVSDRCENSETSETSNP